MLSIFSILHGKNTEKIYIGFYNYNKKSAFINDIGNGYGNVIIILFFCC